LQTQVDRARTAEHEARDAFHRLEMEHGTRQTEVAATRASIERLESQLKSLIERREELQRLLADDRQPEVEFKQKLDVLLQQRLGVEERRTAARQVVTDLESALREQEHARCGLEVGDDLARGGETLFHAEA